MMRDKVFVYLRSARSVKRLTWIMVVNDSRSFSNLVSPQIPIISESSDVHAIIRFSESGSTVYRSAATQRNTYSIRIHLEDILVERRVDPNDVPHLVIDLQLERAHRRFKVDPVEVLQKQDLRVPLAPVPRLVGFGRFADLDHYDVPEISQVGAETYGTTCPSCSYSPE